MYQGKNKYNTEPYYLDTTFGQDLLAMFPCKAGKCLYVLATGHEYVNINDTSLYAKHQSTNKQIVFDVLKH